MESFKKMAKEEYNCSLQFLSKVDNLEDCSNPVSLNLIKRMKKAMNQNFYGQCVDIKTCYDVQYTLEINAPYASLNPNTDFQFYFKNYNVEHLEDSYVYSFITIFSEVGGSLGVLIGLSCMTIVDFFIEIYKTFWKV